MFLEVEGEKLINVDSIGQVELKHAKKEATLWSGGIIIVADSRIAYDYFAANADLVVARNRG